MSAHTITQMPKPECLHFLLHLKPTQKYQLKEKHGGKQKKPKRQGKTGGQESPHLLLVDNI